ncbi:DNA polymerase IV [Campylobacter iguaniorum]|uniref:DNA polymerase Y family protein n=1 Tax=Campylobacter iguaniorum TaxID=1244531 RepID=UPI0007C98062|nr:DNA polymerase IV [Campylobacter iguaniorum]ANE35557.1 DNA polymerase IV [Campylobacter iguaniorum]
MFLHIDLDCFFVSAARVKDPSLNGKVVAVAGGNKTDIFGDFIESGVIVSASYEARAQGIVYTTHSNLAKKICPEIIILPTDFELYKELSNKLFTLLLNFTNEIEKYSIDEYFVDLAGTKFDSNPLEFAKFLKEKIQNELGLPCSIGLSKTKFIAKFATNLAKPNGIRLISSPDEIGEFEIGKFPGVGKSASKFLNSRGITHIKDVLNAKSVFDKLGKNGITLYKRICALDSDKIEKQRQRKSLAMARTFAPIYDRSIIEKRLLVLCRYVSFDVYTLGLNPSKFELKIRYKDRQSISASITLHEIFTQKLLEKTIKELFFTHDKFSDFAITYLSVAVGGLDTKESKSLFDYLPNKNKTIDNALTKIRLKYGVDAIKSGGEI